MIGYRALGVWASLCEPHTKKPKPPEPYKLGETCKGFGVRRMGLIAEPHTTLQCSRRLVIQLRALANELSGRSLNMSLSP